MLQMSPSRKSVRKIRSLDRVGDLAGPGPSSTWVRAPGSALSDVRRHSSAIYSYAKAWQPPKTGHLEVPEAKFVRGQPKDNNKTGTTPPEAEPVGCWESALRRPGHRSGRLDTYDSRR